MRDFNARSLKARQFLKSQDIDPKVRGTACFLKKAFALF
jgi:hypothetical protein